MLFQRSRSCRNWFLEQFQSYDGVAIRRYLYDQANGACKHLSGKEKYFRWTAKYQEYHQNCFGNKTADYPLELLLFKFALFLSPGDYFMFKKIRQYLIALDERRFRFQITLEGILFVVVTLAIGLAAMNTNAQLLFLLFSMMCAFWVLSAIMATSSLKKLTFTRHVPSEVTQLEPVTITLEVENKKTRWVSKSLRLVDFLEDGTAIGAGFVAQVKPQQKEKSTYRCVFPSRGKYKLRRIHMISRYPFGWIKRATARILENEILVLPTLLPVDQVLEMARLEVGEITSNRKGQGAGLYGIRKYQQSESIRDIHWKLSAKSGNLMVREYESDEHRQASVLLDNRLPENPDDHLLERFELAIIVAASLVATLIKSGYQVELVTASGTVSFDERPSQTRRCQRALALLEPASRSKMPPAPTERDSIPLQVLLSDNEPSLSPDVIPVNAKDYRSLLVQKITNGPKAVGAESITMEALAER